jgi:hypothetical protein
MARPPLFEWHGREYAPGEKGTDWYWALGIIVVALMVVSILFANYLLALVLLAAGLTMALQAAKRPRIHRYAITEGGISIDTHHYAFDSMLHFSVLEYIDPEIPPALSIKTNHIFAPHLLIPIVGYDPIDVYDYVALHLPEGKHDESAIDRIVELIGL